MNLAEMPVSVYSADVVVRVPAAADLFAVADALVAADVGALVVIAGDAVHGIVSERDVVRALAERREPTTTTAKDIAHTSLVCCDSNCTVSEVAEEMMEHYVRHVLLEEDGRLVGIVSARDLLGAFASGDTPSAD